MKTVNTKEEWITEIVNVKSSFDTKLKCKEIELMISLGTGNKLIEVYKWVTSAVRKNIFTPIDKRWLTTPISYDEFLKDELKDYL